MRFIMMRYSIQSTDKHKTKAENTDYTNLVSKKNKKYFLSIHHTDSVCFL
jgi:hypothetical protein